MTRNPFNRFRPLRKMLWLEHMQLEAGNWVSDEYKRARFQMKVRADHHRKVRRRPKRHA